MDLIKSILTVAFVVVSILTILLVLVQDDGQNGMGGLFGGRGSAAFGSQSATILTKATRVLVVLFFALAIGVALVNRQPKQSNSNLMNSKTVVETSDTAAPAVTEEAATTAAATETPVEANK